MASFDELPTHQKFVDGVSQSGYRRSSRGLIKEKHVALFVFVVFLTVCLGTFVFVPDFRERINVDEAVKKWMMEAKGGKVQPSRVLPAPTSRQPAQPKTRAVPVSMLSAAQNEKQKQHVRIAPDQQQPDQTTSKGKNSENTVEQQLVPQEQQGKQEEPKQQQVALHAQQQGNKEQQQQQGQLEHHHQQSQKLEVGTLKDNENTIQQQPVPQKQQGKQEEPKQQHGGLHVQQQGNKEQQQQQGQLERPHQQSQKLEVGLLKAGGEHEDAEKKVFVKQMMRHAWRSYETYAWGENELKPVSKHGNTGYGFGGTNMGVTIIDSLDTLYVMGMTDEFNKAKNWVANNLHFDSGDAISVFEGNIRVGGGLLSAYALTGDDIFKTKAKEFADKLLPAFDTATGIPLAMISFRTGAARNWGWAKGGCSILAEFGTLHLEFSYLTEVTGDPVYINKVKKIREVLKTLDKPNGLYSNYLNPTTGRFCGAVTSMGAFGDSFYEYLLKAWIQSSHHDVEAREMYDKAMEAVAKHLVKESVPSKLLYIGEMRSSSVGNMMEHLACFSGGMFALGAATLVNNESTGMMRIGQGIANTCHESYTRSATKLGPDSFLFDSYIEAKAMNLGHHGKHYILRPEVVETYFYLWRLTHNQKYRDWAWDAAKAIETHCRTDSGYSGIKDVYQTNPLKDDAQPSYFLAETLKYLYLIFCDDSVLPLDKWVFNTEAHPLPVLDHIPQGRTP